MPTNYGVKDIKTLEGIEAIRLRPGMYIGSTGVEGIQHITLEIISNAIDEYLNGHCELCTIRIHNLDKPDGYIRIIDTGRGVPFGKAPDGSETLVNVYTKLHTGAKFDSSGLSGYNTSGGLNGVGAKATNALSESFIVTSVRDGKEATAEFKEGTLISYKEKKVNSVYHGTSITFRPDPKIFKEGIELAYEPLKKQLQELAFLSPGLKFVLFYEDRPEEEIYSEKGILDYIDHLNKKKDTLTSVFYAESFENRIGIKIAMQYNSFFSDTYKLYTNSIPNSGGTHLTGFRTALTQSINEYARDKGLLKEKDANFTGDDLKEGLTLVLSLIMPDPVFSGQTKDTLTSTEARTTVQRLVAKEIKIWLEVHEKDAKAIINKAILARTAREKARKAKETVRGTASPKNTRIILPEKLADCSSTDRKSCELFIVEGDSAAGSTKEARDRETQAVFPIRGKILNTMKADLTKIMGNDIIKSLVIAFGLETDGKKIIFNKDKLRYGKIVITADGDSDGGHIRVLFLTFIWKFLPELIQQGYVYAAAPPLYKIIKGKKYIYLKDDRELEDYKTQHKNEKLQVLRMKGYELVWPLSTFPLIRGVA